MKLFATNIFHFMQMNILKKAKFDSLKIYYKDGWNKLDIVGSFLFLIGFNIHFVAQFSEEKTKNILFDIGK